MTELNDWAIIYGDGTVFTHEQGTWADAPALNAQVVVQPNRDVGLRTFAHRDYFLYINGRVLNVDERGCLDYLCNVLEFCTIYELPYPTRFVTNDGHVYDTYGVITAAADAGLIKIGRYLPDDNFRPLYAQATSLKNMPRKSARFAIEPEIA